MRECLTLFCFLDLAPVSPVQSYVISPASPWGWFWSAVVRLERRKEKGMKRLTFLFAMVTLTVQVQAGVPAVSYTHLTLPTILRV